MLSRSCRHRVRWIRRPPFGTSLAHTRASVINLGACTDVLTKACSVMWRARHQPIVVRCDCSVHVPANAAPMPWPFCGRHWSGSLCFPVPRLTSYHTQVILGTSLLLYARIRPAGSLETALPMLRRARLALALALGRLRSRTWRRARHVTTREFTEGNAWQ